MPPGVLQIPEGSKFNLIFFFRFRILIIQSCHSVDLDIIKALDHAFNLLKNLNLGVFVGGMACHLVAKSLVDMGRETRINFFQTPELADFEEVCSPFF